MEVTHGETQATETAPEVAPAHAGSILDTYHTKTDVLGASKIATYLKCPKAFELQYVQRVPHRSSPAAAAGTTIHHVISEGHKLGWGPKDADKAAQALLDKWAEVAPLTSDPANPDSAALIQQAADSLIPWYLGWSETQTNIAVEEQWECELAPGITMRGTLDRAYRADGQVVISDIKTGKRAPSAGDLATDLQLTIYSAAFRRLASIDEDALEIVHLRKREDGLLRTHRTSEYIQAVMEYTVMPTARAIAAGHFPANPSSKFGCGYCDVSSSCPVGQGCIQEAA